MKIAVWHNLPSGGGKRALYHHVKGLVERGHTVESWCPPTADQNYLPLSELITEHIVPLSWKPKSPKTALDRLVVDYQNTVDKLRAIDEHCHQCAEEINVAGFDILFANSCTFFRTTPIGKYAKIPKILYLQEPYRWLYEALPQLPWAALPLPKKAWWLSYTYSKQFLKDWLKVQGFRIQMREECLNAQEFDAILVNSLFSRESVLRAYGLDSKVCYLGIDAELFQPTRVSKEKFVVGLGGIYLGKGIERSIAALGKIPSNKRPDLIWIGNFADKKYQKEMEQTARAMGVNVTFKVRLTDTEVVDLLNRAIALIYTPRLEPFGFAPLEANACRTPVVAIAEGGVRETIKDGINGYLINDDDPVALGEAILKLLENQPLVQQMGETARQYVLENWTWDAAIDRLETHFYSLTEDSCAT
jgi:glycosyltransferase involved in cell wall biosynthesis